MSAAIRKTVLSGAALFLGLSAMFVATGTATAAPQPTVTTVMTVVDCDDEWQTPCP